jgi:hypothetical protein
VSRRARTGGVVAALLVVAAVVALFVSPVASADPDGLERVALDQGFADSADQHALADLPTADYAVRGVDDPRWSTALSGLIGVAVTFALGAGLFALVRRMAPVPGAPGATT